MAVSLVSCLRCLPGQGRPLVVAARTVVGTGCASGAAEGRRLGGMANVQLRRGVSVPESEFEMRASRSGGPGGQSVNKTDSKVELRWSVEDTSALTDEQRARVRNRLANRITDDGVLILQSSEHKSQHRNREAVVARFRALVGEALEPPKKRKPTRRTKASKERRLKAKKHRGELKRLRKPPPA
jgi:ribosome-associated protein